MPNVVNDPNANVGIDTSAGNFTYASSIPSTTRGLIKLAPNTLTLTGYNSYSGPTTVSGGTLKLARGPVVLPSFATPTVWLDAAQATINNGTVSMVNQGSGGGTVSGPAALAANGIGNLQAVQFNGSAACLTGSYSIRPPP